MDVSCPSCRNDYELDDARVPAEGVAVKCAQCGHVFRVKRPDFDVNPAAAPSSDLPPPPQAREWKLRQVNGNLFTCRELTTLQKWIIEGKVGRDDEISLSGDSWKRLGNIPELASFFQVFEEASRTRSYEATQVMPAYASLPSPAPAVRAPAPQPQLAEQALARETLQGGRFSESIGEPPPPPAPSVPAAPAARAPGPPPSWANPSSSSGVRSAARATFEPSDEDYKAAVKSSSRGLWVALAVVGLVSGGGLGYYFGVFAPEEARVEAEKQVADQRAQEEAKTRAEAETRARALAATRAAERLANEAAVDAGADDAGTLDAGTLDAGPTDAGAPDAGSPDAGTPDAGTSTAARTFEWYLSAGDRLRNSDRAEQALNMYGRAVELNPESAEALAGRGLAMLDLGRAPAAQASLEQAVKSNPRYGPALMGLAESYRALGKNAQALEYYQRYLDVMPDGSEADVARGNVAKLKKAEGP